MKTLALLLLSSVMISGSRLSPTADTVAERFQAPAGFSRTPAADHSYTSFLRGFQLKPAGSPVLHYDGTKKFNDVHAAVIDLDVGKRDLQQCADAVMRMRAEYLFQEKRYDDIRFNLTNGFDCTFKKWRQGYRVKVSGNLTSWVKSADPSSSYATFKKYMTFVFIYAGTLSLSKELASIAPKDIQPGDVVIQGGSPGHAILVLDVVENARGQKMCLFAQSYMPAQEMHVLKNYNNDGASPWYSVQPTGSLHTPEWTFDWTDLKRFP